MLIYFRERERERGERASDREEEREGERIQSGLCDDNREPNAGLKLTSHKIMTWAKVGCSTHWATQAPPVSKSLLAYSWCRNSMFPQYPVSLVGGLQVSWKARRRSHRVCLRCYCRVFPNGAQFLLVLPMAPPIVPFCHGSYFKSDTWSQDLEVAYVT